MKKEYDLKKLKKRPGKVKTDKECGEGTSLDSTGWICIGRNKD